MSRSLQAEQVSVAFDGLRALSNVALDIPPARVTGLIGPNGAGKTTLVNVLTGLQSSIYGDDPNPKVTEFNKRYAEVTGAPPSSQYVYPGYVLIEVWAKAVQAAGSTDTAAVTAQLRAAQPLSA
jgi:ABC-type multidrug transport system ATPase subunit